MGENEYGGSISGYCDATVAADEPGEAYGMGRIS
jgi:hypothetical protein